ncbi:MAG: cupin domain-containing protein [Tatlockia sp.]|nr:cupin domain-containing protein [Tatlockia sp.]
MDSLLAILPNDLLHDLIEASEHFPNNSRYPLLIYRQVFNFSKPSADLVQNFLNVNNWINSWVDSIYDYHHYHSNTHEALVIIAGTCKVQIGGPKGKIYEISKGDVIIFPAGVSHKNVGSSQDFKCVGSYPTDEDYDVNYGKAEEHPQVDINIKKVGLPATDPIFGKDGVLFDYWK